MGIVIHLVGTETQKRSNWCRVKGTYRELKVDELVKEYDWCRHAFAV